MTTPGPLHCCVSEPPAPVCEPSEPPSAEGCAECIRCGCAPCACLRQLRRGLFEVVDDADLELPDEIALGRLWPPLMFAPRKMLVPADELHHWFPGLKDSADSVRIAEAMLFAELGPAAGDVAPSVAKRMLRELEQFAAWCAGGPISFSPELRGAVSNIGDDPAFAPEPAGHGWNAAGDTRRGSSNSRGRAVLALRKCGREPERLGRPVSRPRSGRRAAGGLARRAKRSAEGED